MGDGGSTAISTANTAYPVLVILLTLLALLTLFKVTLWPIHMIDIFVIYGFELRSKKVE